MFQKLHEIVHLTCAVDTSVNPTPEFSIWVGHTDREDEMLIESSNEMSKLIYEHELELDDEGAFFYCKMIQMNEYGIIFEDQINSESEPVNLLYEPILDMDQTNTDYIFHNETIRLSVIFLAKPKPEPQDINW